MWSAENTLKVLASADRAAIEFEAQIEGLVVADLSHTQQRVSLQTMPPFTGYIPSHADRNETGRR
jgi:hypothetical protein